MARACIAFPPVLLPAASAATGKGEAMRSIGDGDDDGDDEEKIRDHAARGSRDLYRAVFSVDSATCHLNAVFRALEAPSVVGEAPSTVQVQVPLRGGYCSETRARALSGLLLRRRQSEAAAEHTQSNSRLVFDVCSAEPAMMAIV